MTQTVQTPATVPYKAYQHERNLRIEAERERDSLKNELFLLRKIRRAPALKPIDSAILEEFRHVEKWGKVKDGKGNSRANYTTIARNLNSSGDTIARHAERLEKLQLIEIHEHEGPEDEYERKYVHVREDRIAVIDKIEPDEKITPKQGGNRYICTKCDSTDVDVRTITHKKTTIRCNCCHHEQVTEDTEEDTGWKPQNVHKMQKAQKQLASEKKEPAEPQNAEPAEPDDAQLAEHVVYTVGGGIPDELKDLEQWACHRGKVPYNARPGANNGKAKVNDPTTWTTYEQAQSLYEESQSWIIPYDGIGFMVTKSDPYTFLDFDHCRDAATGEITCDQARRQIAFVDSYAEISLSGTGVHQIARASIPRGVKRLEIEMYDDVRFIVMTGKQLPGTPGAIEDRQEHIAVIYSEVTPIVPRQEQTHCVYASCSLSDQEVLDKARKADNGAKFAALYEGRETLWNGPCAPYRSQSEADLALCKMLAYWTDKDADMIDRLFRQSGLFRPEKWDRAARAGETYGQGTIRMALGEQGRIAS